jgi:hypothetical protein
VDSEGRTPAEWAEDQGVVPSLPMRRTYARHVSEWTAQDEQKVND